MQSCKQPEQDFKLKLTSPVTGSMDAQQFNLSDLTLAVNATGDKLPGKSISSELKGSVQADLSRQSIQGNLAGGLLQSQIKAKLAVNNFSVPMIRYDLEVDQFDADTYMPKNTAAARTRRCRRQCGWQGRTGTTVRPLCIEDAECGRQRAHRLAQGGQRQARAIAGGCESARTGW